MLQFSIFQSLEIEYSVLCERLLGAGTYSRKEGPRHNTARNTSGELLLTLYFLSVTLVLDSPRVCRGCLLARRLSGHQARQGRGTRESGVSLGEGIHSPAGCGKILFSCQNLRLAIY